MKRKHPELTEAEILERILDGSLLLCFDTLRVFSFVYGANKGRVATRKPRTIRIRFSGRTTQYPFVRIKYKGKRRNIGLHRLAWMQHTLKPIPAECQIHHGPEGVECWHPRNLECLTPEEHRERHANEPYEEFT